MILHISRRRGLASVAIATALVLSGCTSDGADDASGTAVAPPTENGTTSTIDTTPAAPTAEDIALVDAIEVSGPLGGPPTVEFAMPLHVSHQTLRLVSDGTGPALMDGQRVSLELVAVRGDNQEQLFDTWEEGQPETFILGSDDLAPFSELLEGAHIGARGIVANPVNLNNEIFTVISVFEVTDAVDVIQRATGEAVTVDPGVGLPVVTLAANGEPSIDIPAGYVPPDHLVVQPLIIGDGPEVTLDSFLTVHYTGWMLDGEVFDSSWARNSAAGFPLTGVIDGWIRGLQGQTVGSQVLLIIPPELAYGEDGSGPIPPNSTLIFVVDILEARTTP